MSIFSLISDIFKPAADLVDNLHTSDEEKLTLKNQLSKMQFEAQSKILSYETKLMDAQASVIKAEASGSKLASSWRPIVMLTFTALIVARWLGLTVGGISPELEAQLFEIVKLGLGGYVVGRSAEKVMKAYKEK